MTVLLLTADYPPEVWSGIGVAVHRQAVDLAALGVRVKVLVVGARGARSSSDANPAVMRIAADEPLPGDLAADWIHLHSLALTELALELRRRLRAKLACTVHTQPWLELDAQQPRRRFWLDAQARLLGACDAVVLLSEAERASAETLFPSLPRLHVIPNGVPAPPAHVPGFDARRGILFAGRFALSKGVRLLAECIAEVRRRSDLRFLIAGGHGDREGAATIERLAREHGAACEVASWLSRDELDARLAGSRLVLVPSRYEPFGLIALEAMRMGAPVLAANVGGLRESVRPGSGGVLLDPANPRRWAEETVRIAGDRDAWTALHQQGRRFVGAHYAAADVAARLAREVYGAGAAAVSASQGAASTAPATPP